MPISGIEMGVDRALRLWGLGKQGMYGDLNEDAPGGIKPWFGDVVGVWKYEAWEKIKGTD